MNAGQPSNWMMYIVVEDAAAAAAKCIEMGGKVLREPGTGEGPKFAIIHDPAGAICGLYQG